MFTLTAVPAFLSVVFVIPALSPILAGRWLTIGSLVSVAFLFPAAVSFLTLSALPASTLPLLAGPAMRAAFEGFIFVDFVSNGCIGWASGTRSAEEVLLAAAMEGVP
jgi:hypothetical protein